VGANSSHKSEKSSQEGDAVDECGEDEDEKSGELVTKFGVEWTEDEEENVE